MKVKLRYLALLAVAALLLVPATALAVPIMGVVYQGDVTIGGQNAPIGTVISAEIEGLPVKSVNTSVEGHYGFQIPSAGNVGRTIEFKVNGVVGGVDVYPDPWETPAVILDLATYTLTVNVDPEDSGSVALSPADDDSVTEDNQYALGTSVTLTPSANPGYGFDSWVGATPAGVDDEATVVMDDNKSVTACFISVGPVAGFRASPLTGNEPLTVEFINESMADSPTWSWDFGDEGTSSEQNPTHQYLQDGIYTVTLTLTTDGVEDTMERAGYIEVYDTEPEASFSAAPTFGDYPLEVSFNDTSTSHDDITSWAWDFGDEGTSTEQNPTYTYEDEGNYTVSLTVTEADEDSDMAEELITVTVPGDTTPPVIEYVRISYYVGTESARPGDSIEVVALVSDDTGVTLVEIETPFGTLPLEMVEYEGIAIYWRVTQLPEDMPFGTHERTLRAVDAAGNEATQTLWLEVTPVLTSYNVLLADGWNLISLPLIPDVADTETVLDGFSFFGEDVIREIWGDEVADSMMPTLNSIWYYDAAGEYGTTGEWLFFEPATGIGDLDELVDGNGYWVDVAAVVDEEAPPPILTVYGVELVSGPTLPPTYAVVEGWNLIGFKETRGMHFSQYLSAVEGMYARIYGYDAYDQRFYTVGEDGPEHMSPGWGYWIYMTEDGYIVP